MTARCLADHLAERPFALAMSSGFFGFFAHAGMLLALDESGLEPARFSGSSAGAMIAGLAAAGLPTRDIATEMRGLKRADFWDPSFGAGLLRGELFRRRIEELLPVARIEDCPRPVAISAFDLGARKTAVLTGGDLATAITASCAFPGLLHPVRRDGRWLTDGGVADRPGVAGLSDQPAGELRLYHPVAAQQRVRSSLSRWLRTKPRHDTITLRILNLPRVHPFALDAGADALELARAATLRALAAPVAAQIDA